MSICVYPDNGVDALQFIVYRASLGRGVAPGRGQAALYMPFLFQGTKDTVANDNVIKHLDPDVFTGFD